MSPRLPIRRQVKSIAPATVTTLVSLVILAGLVLTLVLYPSGLIARKPGKSYELSATSPVEAIEIKYAESYPINGRLNMTTVSMTSADSATSIFEALASFFSSDQDVLPRAFVYPEGQTSREIVDSGKAEMSSAQRLGIVAALRQAGYPVREIPMISGVVVTGPSYTRLAGGDQILAIDDKSVSTTDQIRQAIRSHKVGESVKFTVLRDDAPIDVNVVTVSSSDDPTVPIVGINLGVGYRYDVSVTLNLDQDVVGPSGGLMFALAIYDLLTPEDITAGRTIAGTGVINPTGEVSAIGGVNQKIKASQRDGAEIFLVPTSNCSDITRPHQGIKVVPVDSLTDAVNALNTLKDNPDAEVPHCS